MNLDRGQPISLRDVRRNVRRALRWRKWPVRRRIAVGVWVPGAIAGFVLTTGPFRAQAQSRATTATTVEPWKPAPRPATATTVGTVPANGYFGGALPEITPAQSKVLDAQLQALIDRSRRERAALQRPTAPITRAVSRRRSALNRTRTARNRRSASRDTALAILQKSSR